MTLAHDVMTWQQMDLNSMDRSIKMEKNMFSFSISLQWILFRIVVQFTNKFGCMSFPENMYKKTMILCHDNKY
jgi:hypothetical protein